MAQRIPVAGAISAQQHQSVGVMNSYYKLYRCSDGKYRISLFSMEKPYSNATIGGNSSFSSRKRPLSSTTTVQFDEVSSSTADMGSCPHANCAGNRNPATIEPENCNKRGQQQPRPAKRQRVLAAAAATAMVVKTTSTSADEEVTMRPQRARQERTTVAVADLIAEYIPIAPSEVKPLQEATPSSSTLCCSRSASAAVIPISPSSVSPKWNNWIHSVGKRFPMADMSVRQVLDVLDSRSSSVDEQ